MLSARFFYYVKMGDDPPTDRGENNSGDKTGERRSYCSADFKDVVAFFATALEFVGYFFHYNFVFKIIAVFFAPDCFEQLYHK